MTSPFLNVSRVTEVKAAPPSAAPGANWMRMFDLKPKLIETAQSEQQKGSGSGTSAG
jgi:hypothetical protein